jgi:hypothetical protein
MGDWVFKVFLKNKTEDVIGEWLDGLPAKDRAKIRTRIGYLKTTQVWPQTWCKKYGPCDIYELRIQLGNNLYRPLGFFGPGEKEFTLLIGAKEQGDQIFPRMAPDIAEARRKLVLREKGYTNDFI